MKIGICGASGLGKTELAKMIAKKYKLFPVIESIRDYMKKKKIDWKQLRNEKIKYMQWQSAILSNQIGKEKQLKDNYITDRTSLDYCTFTLLELSKDSLKREIDEYVQVCNEYFDKYDLIFVLTRDNFELIENKVEELDDNVRDIDYNYQRLWELILFGLLKDKSNVCYLTGKSYNERFLNACDIIDDKKL